MNASQRMLFPVGMSAQTLRAVIGRARSKVLLPSQLNWLFHYFVDCLCVAFIIIHEPGEDFVSSLVVLLNKHLHSPHAGLYLEDPSKFIAY